VIGARVEAWRDGIGRFELATARALAPLPVVLEYGAPVLAPGGTLVVWRGARDSGAEAAAARAAEELGMAPAEVRRVHPYPHAHARHLHVFTKEKSTPPRFPRRPGVALKRPLG
jgi:16S rRNA (guanine527-N7)-methyltransferase